MPGKDESRTVDSICVTGEDKEIVKSQMRMLLNDLDQGMGAFSERSRGVLLADRFKYMS